MSAEAIARLRKYVDGTATLGDSRSRVDDLRALLDAHTEALDALRLSNETVVKLAQAATEAQARAEEGVRYWTDLAQAEARDAAALRARVAELEREARRCDGYAILRRELDGVTFCRKEGARVVGEILAERDALRAWVSSVSEALGAIEPVSDCRVELSADAAAALAGTLRAQVEAARAECERILDSMYSAEYRYVAADVLRAMDGAKP